ncbi:MAG TPA: hypothetical protein VFF81_09370 [Noviherbaspirillum sp.]|nr:hypothetical protein [Noviherbaspirillum sp.]
MKKLLFAVTALSLALSGCVVVPDTPSAHVVVSSGKAVVVEPGHCPPGQAKKGRC